MARPERDAFPTRVGLHRAVERKAVLDEEGLRALQERVQNPPSLDEALPASKELVEALTPLAAESPAKYQAQLATAWKFRGVHLGLTEHQEIGRASCGKETGP